MINAGTVDELQKRIFWTRALLPANLNTTIRPSELVPFSPFILQFLIKIIFTKSISDAVLKLIQMKKQGKNV